ncbi:DUF6884 domain-containing protein [Pseudonocardia pini]|uniref:DUF6884 domain-containing protein n=1 Tax=Pseudonocardia pini TaxID=2758030 RepID=UPI001C691C9C|nr:DUF6884 domain-containing protein [Pseudonocardia pini]
MADLILVTCVKAKRSTPAAAKDLYTSPLFTKQRAYAERQQAPWFILSAEYGLVGPDEWLAPYERYLPDTPRSYRAAWGSWVVERLALLAGPLAGKTIEVHAGSTYVDAIHDQLLAKGATITLPLAGLGVGQRLSWYASAVGVEATRMDGVSTSVAATAPQPSIAEFLADPSGALAPAAFLAQGSDDLKVPGLYSWWVDEEGAGDLSAGLGIPLTAGLIYAGLAGATRWPSGRRSTNTLWSRIAGMHLGGRHEFSTFRRTLGAILAHAADSPEIDETALTEWMSTHLVVVTAPYPDPDDLGRLEEQVLDTLDPPLNLRGRPTSPIRARLTELRRPHR